MTGEPDLYGYALGELNEAERREVEKYVAAHAEASQELETIRATAMLVKRLPAEEPPRRIAFVSDKVFERRWWHISLGQGMAFASAMMLAAAIFTHGLLTRPQPAPAPAVDTAQIEQRIQAEVSKVLAEQERRSQERVMTAVAEAERKFDRQRQSDRVAFSETIEVLRKQVARFYLASNERGRLP